MRPHILVRDKQQAGLWRCDDPALSLSLLQRDDGALAVRPPGQPVPPHLAPHLPPHSRLGRLFGLWLRQRDDEARRTPAKAGLTRALATLAAEQIAQHATRQAALARAEQDWNHWVWATGPASLASLLGMPLNSAAAQRTLCQQLQALGRGLTSAAAVAEADAACDALLTALRQADPAAPLQQTLAAHAPPALWQGDEEAFEANRLALLWQSFEAGAALLGNALAALSEQPAPVRQPVQVRAWLPALVNAGGGARSTRRFAQRPLSIGDAQLQAGDALLLNLAGSDAGFGAGVHRCPGQDLALAVAAAALEALPARSALALAAARRARPGAAQYVHPEFQPEPRTMIAVTFEVQPTAAGRQRYLDLAAALKPQLEQIDGFISIERFQSLSDPGKLLSLSFWRDEAAVRAWRTLETHRAAQAKGRAGVFADYRLRVATVLRDYGLRERDEAPADSRARHGG